MQLNVRELIYSPYPAIASTRKRFLLSLIISLFVFGFLSIFQPFGISSIKPSPYLFCLFYGLLTLVVLLAVMVWPPLWFRSFFQKDSWTVGKEMFLQLIILASLSLANYLFTAYIGFFDFSWLSFVKFIFYTLAVAIFPIAILVLIRFNTLNQKNVRISRGLSESMSTHDHTPGTQVILQLKDENDQLKLEIPSGELRALHAADNYTELVWESNGALKKDLIRKPLSQCVNEINAESPSLLFQTHRSHALALDAVERFEGNARGLTAFVQGYNKQVPVSRTRIDDFKQVLAASH